MNNRQPAASTTGHRANILLVDDRPENLMALEELLTPLGQNLISVRSGEEALAALLDNEVALILLDVRMPGIDGFETAGHIKRREKSRHIPIIFLTAISDDVENALRGYSEGAVDYLVKPFNPYVLRSKVAVFVELDAKTQLLREQARALERSNVELAALAEAAEAASRAKSAFLNMVGHELRTPLAVVSGYASLMLSNGFGELASPLLQPLRVLEAKADELRQLVETLLAAAQLESGGLPEELERVDLNDAAEDAVVRARPRAELMQAELSFSPADEPVHVDIDPRNLARVLDNLINNALTYGGQDPWVRVRVEVDEASAGVSVEDHGVGIPMELRERIFERFVRGNSGGLGPPGAGLGLYICRELIEGRGGSLRLESTAEGEGSTFAIRFPVAGDRRPPQDGGESDVSVDAPVRARSV
jgi:signal transduction histidine kinase